MTTPTMTRTTRTTDPLDDLAVAAAQVRDDARSRAVLAVVVQRLEDAAHARLGTTDAEPLVVLQRRFGRAHARLAARSGAGVDADLLLGLARALEPEPAAAGRPASAPRTTPALVGC